MFKLLKFMCCSNCTRGPQGPAGSNSVSNILYQDNTGSSSTLIAQSGVTISTDAEAETFLMSNANRLEYICTANARYRVSFQARIESTSGTEVMTLAASKGTGTQATPNLGSGIAYLGVVTYSITGSTSLVYEFDITLVAGESIGIYLENAAGTANLTLKDNLFIVDKII